MDEWLGNALLVFAGIVVTGTVSYLTTRLTSSTQKKTAEIESNGPNWKSFTEEIREQNAATEKRLNGRINALESRISSLKTEVQSLRGRFQMAMSHIAAWRRNYPDSHLMDSLPRDLHDDLPPDLRL